MRLVLDVGNTRVKYGLFKNGCLESSGDWQEVEKDFDFSKVEQLAVSSVNSNQKIKIPEYLKVLQMHTKMRLPFLMGYETPETLGIDRLLACVGAFEPNQDFLVIDAGSCITYDIVDAKKGYLGGGIAPGLQMRFRSMHNFTAHLPLISEFDTNVPLIGSSTKSAMLSGGLGGMIREIDATINDYKSNYPNLKVYLTGGDANFFVSALKSLIFADQHLVLKGMNVLIELNDK